MHQAWIVAGAFVAWDAAKRFGNSPSTRASTTRDRYVAATVVYTAANLVAYAIIAGSPELLRTFAPRPIEDALARESTTAVTPFLAALITTTLLPQTPILADVDAWLRRSIQEVFSIPYRAILLSRQLRGSRFSVPGEYRAEVREFMRGEGFSPAHISFEDDGSSYWLWTRLSTLVVELRGWDERARRIAAFYRTFRDEHESIQASYHRLAKRAARIADLELAMTPTTDARMAAALEELRATSDQQATQLHRALCDFISRAVLMCRMTEKNRTAELRAMGFEIVPGPAMFHRLLTLFLAFLVFYEALLLSSFDPTRFDATGRPPSASFFALLGVMISVTYCSAVFWGLYFRTQHGRTDPSEERPVGVYVSAGLAAAGFSLLCNFSLRLLFADTIYDAATVALGKWPWCLLAFTTAVVTAFHCDTYTSNRRWPLVEGLSQAAITVAAGFGTYHLLLIFGSHPAPELWRVLFAAVVVGGSIGVTVPRWHRSIGRTSSGSSAANIQGVERDTAALAA